MTTPTQTQAPTQITAAQLRSAYALARAHGHEWASVDLQVESLQRHDPEKLPQIVIVGHDTVVSTDQGAALALPAPAADLAEFFEAALGERSMPGLPFATAHTTGSGRLTWAVEADGSVVLTVRRPGATLLALRALDTAAKTAWSGAESLRPLLEGLAGQGLRHGYASESPLGAAIHDASAGVAVLTCTVAPGGEVAITEATRWDTTSDEDSAELRHWLTLRDALAVLGHTLPRLDVRAEVASAIDAFDAACAPVQAARRVRDASCSEESHEALRQAEEAAAPAIAAAASASIFPCAPVAQVEMAPRRRGGLRPVVEVDND